MTKQESESYSIEAKSEPERLPVKVIETKGKSALVEYGFERRFVPSSSVGGNAVPSTVWEAGIPYGVPWEKVPPLSPTELAAQLWKRGIWTSEDLRANQQQAVEAIRATHRIYLGDLNKFAKEVQK
jgi:hypothetical protein